MGLFIKICGLTSAQDVEAVAALKPDALGFVFYPKSPRCVQARDVAAWTQDLPAGLLKCGVFVDCAPDEVRAIVDEAGLDVLQLHGNEHPEHFQSLGKKIWRVVKLGSDASPICGRENPVLECGSLLATPQFHNEGGLPLSGSGACPAAVKPLGAIQSGGQPSLRCYGLASKPHALQSLIVDAFLIDTYSKSAPGGTGERGDWDLAAKFVCEQTRPVLLAGGLTPENVEEAVRRVRPFGVDVSSGVEVKPGLKDLAKVKDFIQRCRNL